MRCYHCKLEIAEEDLYCYGCGSPQKFTDFVERALKDDQEALSQLYKMTYNNVYQTVRSVANLDDDTVFDLIQNTYIKAFRSLSQLKEPEAFRGWVKVISRNLTIDYLRKKKVITFSQMVSVDSDEMIEFEDDRVENLPEVVVDKKETAKLLGEILDQLSEEQRIAVYMYYFEQMSVKEIADILGVSEGTVKSRLNYGRKKIEAGVKELEKKGTKLYGLAPIPFLLALFKGQEAYAAELPNPAVLHAVEKELASGTAGAAQAGSATGAIDRETTAIDREAATAAGKEAVKTTAGAAGKSVLTKVIAGVAAAAVIGAGAAGVASRNREKKEDTKQEEVATEKENGRTEQENVTTEQDIPIKNLTVDDFIGGYTNEEYLLELSYVDGQLFLSSGILPGKEMFAYAYDDAHVEGNTLKAVYEDYAGDAVNDDGIITESNIDREDIFILEEDGTITVTFAGVNKIRSGRYQCRPDLPLDDTNLVTDAYHDVIYDGNYTQEMLCYHIPQINLRGSSDINLDIYTQLYGILNKDVYDNMGDADYFPYISKMAYSWGIKNKSVSVLVETSQTDFAESNYYVYNVSADTGKEISAEELVGNYGLTINEFYNLAEDTLKAFLDTQKEEMVSSANEEIYEDCVEQTLSEENVKAAIPYINEKGELCIVTVVYTPAGAGHYWYHLNTSTKCEENSIECQIDHLHEGGAGTK